MKPGSAPTTSIQLLALAKAGDSDALDALIRRYLPRLRRWARGRLPTAARGMLDTEDIVMETAMKAARCLPKLQLEAEGALQAWLRGVLANRFKELYRGYPAGKIPEDLASDMPAIAASPLESAIGAEAVARYDTALQALAEDDRLAIILRIELCLGYDEIAVALQKRRRQSRARDGEPRTRPARARDATCPTLIRSDP
jgi:RNA polymerase sigma factor (sigma-70 family)